MSTVHFLSIAPLSLAAAAPARALAPPAQMLQPRFAARNEAGGVKESIESLRREGRSDAASRRFADAIARRPLDLELESDLADVLTWANRPEEAERLYEQVLARDGHHHEALKGLARARLLRGDAAAAAAVIDRALELYPKDVDLHAARARMLSQKGQLDGAIQALKRAVQLAPSDSDVLSLLAETYQQKQDWPNAQETWL